MIDHFVLFKPIQQEQINIVFKRTTKRNTKINVGLWLACIKMLSQACCGSSDMDSSLTQSWGENVGNFSQGN